MGSGVTSRIGRLEVDDHLPVLHKAPTLRSTNVRLTDGNDELIQEVTFRALCVDGAWEPRTSLITSQHISWDKFRAVAAKALNLEPSEVLAFHGNDKISNAHELEAAVNDHCNGLRRSDAFEVSITKLQRSTRPKLHPTAIPTTSPGKSADLTPVDSGSRLAGHGKGDEPHDHSDESEDDVRPAYRRGQVRVDGGSNKKVGVGGAGPAPPGPSPTTPKKPSRATRTLRSPTLSPGKKDDPPLPPILEGTLPDVEDDTGIPEDVDEEEDIAAQLLEYATNLLNNSNAGLAAALVDEKYWRAAADMFDVPLKRLLEQSTSKERYIRVSADFGFNPEFGLMAHQMVGIEEGHNRAFGAVRGFVLGDMMGLGKTVQINVTWFLNLILVFEMAEGKKIRPNQRPALDAKKKFKDRLPRVGATFLSAYSAGVEPWPRDFVKITANSPMIEAMPDKWKPKMIILHALGPKLCEKYGGEQNCLYSKLTREDLWEMCPSLDWEDKRRVRGSWENAMDCPTEFITEWSKDQSQWRNHPQSSKSRPSPTSTRFFIVSTNQSWKSNVYEVLSTSGSDYAKLVREENLAKTLTAKDEKMKTRRALVKQQKTKTDGSQLHQVRRKATWAVRGTKTLKKVDFVWEGLYAAWVIVDEIHSAGGEDTITYKGIIQPFRNLADPENWPSVTAITGSALANGITTIITFGVRALVREDDSWKSIDEPVVQLLQKINLPKTMNAWKSFLAAQKSRKGKGKKGSTPNTLQGRIDAHKIMSDTLTLFPQLIAFYFISRGYDTLDPIGKKLNLLDCKLESKYLSLKYAEDEHQILVEAEQSVAKTQQEMWEAQLQEWRDGGCHGDKPKRPSASSADSRGYYKSKVLATFPNLYKAIYAYQKANPDAAQIFGEDCDWEDSVGTDNLALDDILSTSTKIRNSPLYECIDDICKGSAKMSYILQQAKDMEGKFDVRRESDRSEHRYQQKITLATNIRLVKAIIYAVCC
ncbi:hypothetical protein NX059_012335 [Plenodomus lindquistii]|nr:hypothetical protein NX059_012335 [Plenodomus lindquistii]